MKNIYLKFKNIFGKTSYYQIISHLKLIFYHIFLYISLGFLIIIMIIITTYLNQYFKIDLSFLILFSILTIITILFGSKAAIFSSFFIAILNYQYKPMQFQYSINLDRSIQSLFFIIFGIVNGALAAYQKKKENLIKKNEKHFRKITDQSLYPIILKNEKGALLFASNSIKNILGFDSKEMLGKNIIDFVHADDIKKFEMFYSTVLTNPNKISKEEIRFKNKQGDWVWLNNIAINLLHDNSVKAIVASFHDITKRKQLDELKMQLLLLERGARKQSEQAVRERDEFLAIASHELKTPLTTLVLQIQSTLRRILTQSLADFSGEKLVKSLTTAEEQSKRMAKLIKDLLNVSLVSTGKLELELKNEDLVKIVQRTIDSFLEQEKNEKQNITFRSQNKEIIGQWDSIRLEQAVFNLLSNAAKYGNGNNIEVLANSDPAKKVASISVKDQGIGIDKKNYELIFERFKRIDNKLGKKGLGIGLFIVKQIVEAHQGIVYVESKLNKGSSFTISLPIK